jgi:sec-independent protein translocase protein TatA
MPEIGPMELGVILLIVVMIFGVGKLPEAATSLGKAIKEFKRSSKSTEDTEDEVEETHPRKKIRKTPSSAKLAAAISAKSMSTEERTVPSSVLAVKSERAEAPVHAA